MNIEQARFNMIEQQIRPWDVLDVDVLDLLSVVKREQFVPAAYRSLAFVDMEIPLPLAPDAAGANGGENMFAPKLEARLLQELAVPDQARVLEIGTGSGYMAALLAQRAASVVTVEIHAELKRFAEGNLAANGVRNVKVELGDGARGWAAAGECDIIMVSGSVPVVPEALLRQMAIGGRLAAIVGDLPVMAAQLITRTGPADWDKINLFETVAKPLVNAPHPPRFQF